MIRTQIYLPEVTHQQLKSWARSEHKSMAEKVRELLEKPLVARTKTESVLELLMGHTYKGIHDLSERHDEYLYDHDA